VVYEFVAMLLKTKLLSWRWGTARDGTAIASWGKTAREHNVSRSREGDESEHATIREEAWKEKKKKKNPHQISHSKSKSWQPPGPGFKFETIHSSYENPIYNAFNPTYYFSNFLK